MAEEQLKNGRCGFCGKEVEVLYRCQLYGAHYCKEHIAPRAHNCIRYPLKKRRDPRKRLKEQASTIHNCTCARGSV